MLNMRYSALPITAIALGVGVFVVTQFFMRPKLKSISRITSESRERLVAKITREQQFGEKSAVVVDLLKSDSTLLEGSYRLQGKLLRTIKVLGIVLAGYGVCFIYILRKTIEQSDSH